MNQPISRDLLARVEEAAHDADLTHEPSDLEYAQNVFQSVKRVMKCNPNGVSPIVGRLMLRKFARHRKDNFGLVPLDQEPPLEVSVEEQASAVLALGPAISMREVELLARRLPYESPHPAIAGPSTPEPQGRAFYSGAMCRGGISSLRKSCGEFPDTIRCLTRLLRRAFPHMTFSSLALLEDVKAGAHRDSRNEQYPNLLLSLTRFEGGAVWEENELGNVVRPVKGQPTTGRLLDVSTGPQVLQAHSKFHQTEPWSGRRLLLVGYTVSRLEFLSEDQRNKLRDLGFVMPGDATRGEEGGQCLLDPAPVELRKVEAIPLAQDFDTWRGNYEFTIVPESNFRTYLAGRREREDWERAVEGHTWYRGGAIIDEAAQAMFRADETHERMAVAAVTSGVLQQRIHNGDMILREYLQDPRDHGPSDPSEPMPTCELLGQVRNLYADPRSHREYHIGFRLIRTVEDVDGQGNYLGDQFFLIRCRVEPSQREQSIADVDMMSRVLRRGDRRHRASYEGSNGNYYFSSIPLLHPSAHRQGSTAPASASSSSQPAVRALTCLGSSELQVEEPTTNQARQAVQELAPPLRLPTIPVAKINPAVLISSSLMLPVSQPQSNPVSRMHRAERHLEPQAGKLEVYTKDVESKLEGLGEGLLETTYTVSPAEARKHADRWKPALQEEISSLEKKEAIIRRRGPEAQALRSDPSCTTLHAKGVYTVKPGKFKKEGPKEKYRRRARIVACGNESKFTDASDLYAAGVAGDVLRASLLKAGASGWKAFGTDVHTAFLLAPLGTSRRYLLQPPAILQVLGLVEKDEVWEVGRAIYGLRESPRWWTEYRNKALSSLKFKVLNPSTQELEECHLEQGTTESNIFKIRGPQNELKGLLVCYVDDFLMLTSAEVADALHGALSDQLNWELDPLQEATKKDPLRFLGVGIRPLDQGQGFALEQQAYIEEMLARNGFSDKGSSVVCPRELLEEGEPEDPEARTYPEDLKTAQRLTGELLWLAQKSRPDIAFVVQWMAAHVTSRPSHVARVAHRIFKFLERSKGQLLELRPQANRGLEVFTDASFAPSGKHSQGGLLAKFLGGTLMWRASKLPLIAISSAEAELQALSEGAVYAQSLQAVLHDVVDEVPAITLMFDSTSAIALAEGGSSQRTRHLQVRAAALTQQIGTVMSLEHCPGDVQCADLLTKPLGGSRLQELSALVGLRAQEEEGERPSLRRVEVATTCGEALSKWLGTLATFAQLLPTSGQDPEEEEIPGISSDAYIYIALVVVVIAIVGLWEGLKVAGRALQPGPRPSIRALRKRDRLEKAVREALDKEVTSPTPPSSGQTGRRRGRSSSQPPAEKAPLPTGATSSTTTVVQMSRFSQTEVLDGGRITRRSQGVQTDPVPQASSLLPPTGVNPGVIMTTMQKGSVVHLYHDCGHLGTPAYRQHRTFCRQCLARANLRP